MQEDLSEKIVENVKYLRRYARALLGSQQTGDMYVRLCLETLVQERDVVSGVTDINFELFVLFHDVWRRLSAPTSDDPLAHTTAVNDFSIRSRLDAIPTLERQILLLTTL